MSRKKVLRPKETPVIESTERLLERIQTAVKNSGNVTISGKPIEQFHPLEFLAVAATNEALPWKDRIDCAKELSKYVASQRKSVQETTPVKPLQIRLRNFGEGPDTILIDGRKVAEVPEGVEWDGEVE